MGGSESSYGNRKVSFGLDEQERVRVLQGIRLSEDVVNRMKETSQLKGDQRPSSFPSPSSYGTASSPQAAKGKPKSTTGIHPPTASSSGQKPSEAEEDLYKRYEREQALVQEELLRLAKREREAGSECLNTNLQREKNSTNEERQKATRMNAEIYKLTSEQFHEAATGAENHIKRRNTEPICGGLQSEILKCYQENKHEVLKCSELAKEYQRCVSSAQKGSHQCSAAVVSASAIVSPKEKQGFCCMNPPWISDHAAQQFLNPETILLVSAPSDLGPSIPVSPYGAAGITRLPASSFSKGTWASRRLCDTTCLVREPNSEPGGRQMAPCTAANISRKGSSRKLTPKRRSCPATWETSHVGWSKECHGDQSRAQGWALSPTIQELWVQILNWQGLSATAWPTYSPLCDSWVWNRSQEEMGVLWNWLQTEGVVFLLQSELKSFQ
ncbi:MICOS complex subunit MIC25 isoform X7 [Dermochelys coriacea]|uniref:MICOS complex subunit MIC25 isoform X7 n=1 Tax=Dermochelys coriacea TaxID=27794 RepID=UPI001CA91920|nr:MICOS complex subunit MIC25 isoform X7 [Dermochelys coriacea]